MATGADDHPWFERAVLEVLPGLLSTALRLTKNRADAEDLVADAVAKAWLARGSLRDRDRFRGWIFRILSNRFLSNRRAQTMAAEESLEATGAEFSLFERLHQPFLLWWSTPEQEFLDRLTREDLLRAIDRLPELFRIVVVLADVQGFSYQAIAETLGIPVGTVRSRLARGRGQLQAALWEHACDAGLRPTVNPRRPDTA